MPSDMSAGIAPAQSMQTMPFDVSSCANVPRSSPGPPSTANGSNSSTICVASAFAATMSSPAPVAWKSTSSIVRPYVSLSADEICTNCWYVCATSSRVSFAPIPERSDCTSAFSSATYRTIVIESALTPGAVAPPLSSSNTGTHGAAYTDGTFKRPVSVSQRSPHS